MTNSPSPIIMLGAGYTCEHLAALASERGHRCYGTARTSERAQELVARGVEALMWEASEGLPTGDALPAGAAVVYSVPTLFEEYEEAADGALARHVEPVERGLAWAEGIGASRFIYLSSTSVYGDHKGAEVDEGSECTPIAAYGRMRLEIERHVLSRAQRLDTNVARLVGIYGPGRTMLESIRSGRYRVVDSEKLTNRVHVHDIARALLAMVERGPSGARLYNISDGSPVTVGALLRMLCEEFGLEAPAAESLEQTRQRAGSNTAARWEASYRCVNRRMVEELGVEPMYRDALEGYRAILRGEQG